MINPNSRSKAAHLNDQGNDVFNDFPTRKNTAGSDLAPSIESRTLIRWIESVQPKAVISLRNGNPGIIHKDCPDDVLHRLQSLSERPLKERPVFENSIGETHEMHNLEKNIGEWCSESGIIWLDFTVDAIKKSFDDVREDWRLCLGPALKWLLEGPRFNPPAEEPLLATHTVIPTLDLPPELANLR